VPKDHIKLIADNRKALFEYFVEERFEAGMVLTGTEVKSLRQGRANLKDSYGRFKKDGLYILQMHISPYPFAYYDNHDPLRPRKLLLHKHELHKLYGKINERGYSLIPLRLYFRDSKVKLEIALAKGKHQYDKRESIKQRENKREMDRVRKEYK